MNYLRRTEAADYLQAHYGLYTAGTLAKMAVVGGGPPFRLLGRFPVYTEADLRDWAEGRMTAPVSSTAAAGSQRQRANAA